MRVDQNPGHVLWLSAAGRANLSCQCCLVQPRPRHFLEMPLLSTHIRNKPSKCIFTPNGQLSRTSGVPSEDVLCECCSATAWHGMHFLYSTCWANINKQIVTIIEKVMTQTVFLPLEWILPTFWYVANYTLSHTPNQGRHWASGPHTLYFLNTVWTSLAAS